MDRRKFVLGIGSLAAGGAAAMGTGAFSSAQINDRAVEASVVNDNSALLRLNPSVSQHATQSGGKLKVSIQDLSQDSEYTFKQLFRIHNDGGNNPVEISASMSGGLSSAVNDARAYGPHVVDGTSLISDSVTIAPGEYVDVGATVVTTDGVGSFDGGGDWAFTIHADEA
ncbi:hypothetical protein G9C85_02875 [Halorubellus sp. JP-L1]|uniref:hypothetical protein n=1 Tax=Halorubellus sp. JP-L1 TaxID=2715753 RepID=UPI00140E222A|nr:hypothetical protein [Halorubellus sp. JP-L1]NHN40581.1 hypothetical protein [Halorubellus sp. JP-L1]